MAGFAQMPLPTMVHYSFTSSTRRSSDTSSSSSLVKSTPRFPRSFRRIADPDSSVTILHGRPSMSLGEDLPPYSLDTTLPPYSFDTDSPAYSPPERGLQDSQPDPEHMASVPKYLSMLIICMSDVFVLFFLFLFLLFVCSEDSLMRTRLFFSVSEVRGNITNTFTTSAHKEWLIGMWWPV